MIKDVIINIIAGIIFVWLGWAAKTFYNRKKYSVFRFVRRFKVFHSGAQGYYYSFPPEDNKKAWEYVKNKFYYLGISSNTFNNELMDFMKSEKGISIEYRFLLMNPENDAIIKKQEAYKNGYQNIDLLMEDERKHLNEQVEITKNSIINSADKIKNTEPFKKGKVQIKYCNEFLPWWLYIFDEAKVYVGLLEFGKDGRCCPLVLLEKNEKHFTLYNSFEANWSRIWSDAYKCQ